MRYKEIEQHGPSLFGPLKKSQVVSHAELQNTQQHLSSWTCKSSVNLLMNGWISSTFFFVIFIISDSKQKMRDLINQAVKMKHDQSLSSACLSIRCASIDGNPEEAENIICSSLALKLAQIKRK